MKRPSQAVLVFLILTLATILMTWPFITVMDGTLLEPGDSLLQTWTIGYNVQRALTNPAQLFNAPIFYPYAKTLAFSDGQFAHSLVAAPIVLATGNPVLAYNLDLLLSFVLNGLALYLLVRAWGGNFWGALIGGLIFAFSSYHFAHITHLNIEWTQWLPLMLLYLDRSLVRSRIRDFFLFGLFFLLWCLSSFYYAFFALAVVGVYFLWRLAGRRGRLPVRTWAGLALTLLAAALLLFPFGLPYIQVSSDLGLRRVLTIVGAGFATPEGYLFSLSHNAAFSFLNRLLPRPGQEALLFPGVLAVLLAAYGLYRREPRDKLLPLLLIAGMGLVFSFGVEKEWGNTVISLPYSLLYDNIPGFQSMRALGRWGVLVLLAAAVLAGFGFSELIRRLNSHGFAAPGLGLLLLAGLFLEYNQSPMTFLPGRPFAQPLPPVYQWLAKQPDGAVVELPMGLPGVNVAPEQWYQYYTLFTHKPLVNGRSGFRPPSYVDTYTRLLNFPSQDSLDLLRSIGVRYVVVHGKELQGWSEASQRLPFFQDSIRAAAAFGGDSAYDILPGPLPPAQLDLVVPDAVEPGAAGRGYLFARSPSSRSAPLARNGIVEMRLRWVDETGRVRNEQVERMPAPLVVEGSGQIIPFDLHAPSAPGRWRVDAALSGLRETVQLEREVAVKSSRAAAGGPMLQLENTWVPTRATLPGSDLVVTLSWKVHSTPDHGYNVLIQVVDDDGNKQGEQMVPLAADMTAWQPESRFVARYKVPLSKGAGQGRYSLLIGLWNPVDGKFLPIQGPDGSVEEQITADAPVWVSAGAEQPPPKPEHQVRVLFQNGRDLVGYDLPASNPASSSNIRLVLYWQDTSYATNDYTVFVHLVNGQGKIVAQGDGPPQGGNYPTSVWLDGEWVRDPHTLVLSAPLQPGTYTLRVGWYLPATNERVPTRGDPPTDHVDLTTIEIK